MQGMKVKLLAFAQAADQIGFRERIVDCSRDDSPRRMLTAHAPLFDCSIMRVAVDGEYRDWDAAIGEAREIAIIPPVSGG